MSRYRRRALLLWGFVAAIWLSGVALSIAFFVFRPEGERHLYTGGFVVYAALVFLFFAWRAARVAGTIRADGEDAGVVFTSLNHRGALVYADRFLIPGREMARGQTFIVVVGEKGIEYRAPYKGALPFVRIPWSAVEDVFEAGGELGIALQDDGVQFYVPGGMLPVGTKRVRALAAHVSVLRRERQL